MTARFTQGNHGMVGTPEGEWVQYEDHAQLLALVKALPKVEGEITVTRDSHFGEWLIWGNGEWIGRVDKPFAEAFAALLQARQALEESQGARGNS